MIELIATFGITPIILILLIGIPAIVNFIIWCKKLWKQRTDYTNENIQRGRDIERAEEAEEHRFESGESRISKLESIQKQQADLITELKLTNDRLVRSERLAIKTWIKEQHDIWVPKGCIDGQILELLEQRFEIYREEGGNSWAEKLMNDMRALPIVTIIPLTDTQNKQ